MLTEAKTRTTFYVKQSYGKEPALFFGMEVFVQKDSFKIVFILVICETEKTATTKRMREHTRKNKKATITSSIHSLDGLRWTILGASSFQHPLGWPDFHQSLESVV